MGQAQWKRYLIGTVGGVLLGSIVLHPFSMLFQGMILPEFSLNFKKFADAFNPHHLPMALFFGLLGGVVGAAIVFLLGALLEEKERVKILEGLLPICSYCKKIRERKGDELDPDCWTRIEDYITDRTDADFTHGVCPECYKKMLGEIKRDLAKKDKGHR